MSAKRESPRGAGLGSALSAALDHARATAILGRGRRRVAAGWESLTLPLRRSYADSTIHGLGRWLARTTRHSVCYRWLTREPEPEVVVIDLRETWTVGPLITVGERVASTGPVRRAGAGTVAVGEAIGRPFERAPVRVASVAVLGFAATALALTWTAAGTPARVAWLGVLAVATLGLRVDATWQQVADSRLGTALRAVFEPPDLPDERDDE